PPITIVPNRVTIASATISSIKVKPPRRVFRRERCTCRTTLACPNPPWSSTSSCPPRTASIAGRSASITFGSRSEAPPSEAEGPRLRGHEPGDAIHGPSDLYSALRLFVCYLAHIVALNRHAPYRRLYDGSTRHAGFGEG